VNRWTDIGKITSIKQDTCRKIVKAFHEKNNQIKSTSKRGRAPQPLPPDVKEYLRTSLNDNKFLSLRQRVKIIEHELGFPITLKRLWSSYRRMDIKYRSADSVLANSDTPALRQERVRFARQLSSLMIQKRRIIFADESSTRIWAGKSYIKKTW
jgi:transposase